MPLISNLAVPMPKDPKAISSRFEHNYNLCIVRHGQSEWNKKNQFTGWFDSKLSEQGKEEAETAGNILHRDDFRFDVAFTSLLSRAIKTCNTILEKMDLEYLPVIKAWQLNERHYGDLQGLNKKETMEKYGEDQVKLWRRGYATQPPQVAEDSPYFPKHDPRYAHLENSQLPRGESLADVTKRVIPYWEESVVPYLQAGKKVLIVAHGNSLRALIKHLEHLNDDEIVKVELGTGQPELYELDENLGSRARYVCNSADETWLQVQREFD